MCVCAITSWSFVATERICHERAFCFKEREKVDFDVCICVPCTNMLAQSWHSLSPITLVWDSQNLYTRFLLPRLSRRSCSKGSSASHNIRLSKQGCSGSISLAWLCSTADVIKGSPRWSQRRPYCALVWMDGSSSRQRPLESRNEDLDRVRQNKRKGHRLKIKEALFF